MDAPPAAILNDPEILAAVLGLAADATTGGYASRDVRRPRSTKAEMQQRDDRLIELAAEHQPCSVRHLYYRAVVDGLPRITKDHSGYLKVQRATLALRRAGRLPYAWIVDNSRTVFAVDTFDGLDEFLADAAGVYRRDLWRRSPYRVEVWCESDSIAGTLNGVTSRWRVPLFPTRGQSSETFPYLAVEGWAQTPARRPVVLYVGDHDPAGLEIETSLAEKLSGFAEGRTPTPEFHRLGVTWQQATDLDLPGTKPKKPYGYPRSVEAEALPPRVLREIVDDAISDYVDPDELQTLLAVEQGEREDLHELAATFAGAS